MRHVEVAEFRVRYGPWALVAGASAGLGAEFAAQLAAKGLNLVLIARRKEMLDELAATLMHDHAIEVRTLQLDLGSDDIDTVVTAATRLIANYAATKAYSRVLGEGLWEELRAQGIDVVTCSPSSISTPAYLASASSRSGRMAGATMTPREVAAETLAALGKQPVVIPGRGNRLANVLMQRIFPRKMAIGLMGRVMRSMYPEG